MAFPAAGRAAEMHPAVERELLERKPLAASRALLLRDGLNTSHCFCDTFSAERLNRENLDGGLQASMFSTTPFPRCEPVQEGEVLSVLCEGISNVVTSSVSSWSSCREAASGSA
jgi:hypothetical protein